MPIAIVFIHKGYSDYMEYSLRQARSVNRDSEIVLLGDESNNRFDFVTYAAIKDYFKSAEELAGVYKHYSTNNYDYELFCIQRWFILKEYMRSRGMDNCFVCDTDVMIYSDINEALAPFQDGRLALMSHYEEYSFGISFASSDKLESFCEYVRHCYGDADCLRRLEKYYKDTVKTETVGGVSDMIFVRNWVKTLPEGLPNNLSDVRNGSTFDSHMGLPMQKCDDLYAFRLGEKLIVWHDAKPYCYSYSRKEEVRFHLLHFQGPAKFRMAHFYTGPDFAGKRTLDAIFAAKSVAAFWYKTLKIRYRFAWLFNLIFKLKKRCRQ